MQICAAAANSRCLFPLPKGFRIQSTEGNVNGENIPKQHLWSAANKWMVFFLFPASY